jgi:heme-degrading monooxygenase HmoA
MTSLRGRKSGAPKAQDRSSKRKPGEWGYLIIWEFQVRAGMEQGFERVYGSDGDWARLFIQDESYFGTHLVRSLNRERTYVTLDFWRSQPAYDKFRKRHFVKYTALDQKCEDLTESERKIGEFGRVPSE